MSFNLRDSMALILSHNNFLFYSSCSSSSQGTITDDSGIHSGNTFNTNEKENNSREEDSSNNSSPSVNVQYRETENEPQNSGIFGGLGRSQVTRRPIRKLPAVPGVNSKQAHIVNLPSLISSSKSVERKSTRALPSLPTISFSSISNSKNQKIGSQKENNGRAVEKPNTKSNKGSLDFSNANDNSSQATHGGWIKSTTRLSNFFRSVKFSRWDNQYDEKNTIITF